MIRIRLLSPAALILALACNRSPATAPATSQPAAPPVAAKPAADAVTPESAEPSDEPTWVAAEPPSEADARKVAASSNAFGFDLYPLLSKERGNLAFSPASIATALAMTWCGARQATEMQMRKVLHASDECGRLARPWGRLTHVLQDPSKSYQLHIANRLFGEKSYRFELPYLQTMRGAFYSLFKPLDFKTAPDAARTHINGWVEQRTKRRIRDLLPPPSITPDTRLVLVNAIYFLADWQEQFEKEGTSPQPFTTGSGAKKDVPMMRQQASFRLLQADGIKLLELPYQGNDVAMLIALPDKADGLPALEQLLAAPKLAAWRAALGQPQPVDVALPSFTYDPSASMELKPVLKALGMTIPFDRKKADFGVMAKQDDPAQRLFVADVFHKAFVKVDEKGTEAAAATAVEMAVGAAPPKAIEFRADHPFVYLIVDQKSGLVLFLGRVVDPALAG